MFSQKYSQWFVCHKRDIYQWRCCWLLFLLLLFKLFVTRFAKICLLYLPEYKSHRSISRTLCFCGEILISIFNRVYISRVIGVSKYLKFYFFQITLLALVTKSVFLYLKKHHFCIYMYPHISSLIFPNFEHTHLPQTSYYSNTVRSV